MKEVAKVSSNLLDTFLEQLSGNKDAVSNALRSDKMKEYIEEYVELSKARRLVAKKIRLELTNLSKDNDYYDELTEELKLVDKEIKESDAELEAFKAIRSTGE